MVSGDWWPAVVVIGTDENLQGYGPNINTGVSHSSSMIVPAVTDIFQFTPTSTQILTKVAGTLSIQMQTMTQLQPVSSTRLKTEAAPSTVSAQDIVLQPFLVQSGEKLISKAMLLITQKLIQPYCTVTKTSKVFVLDLRSGKIKDGTQDSENVPGSATYNRDEIDGVDLDDNDACYGDDDTDADASTNGNEHENDPFVQRCKGTI